MDVSVLKRILDLEIRNFRGFIGCHHLDTDADIVLLAGPNGFGKTSLLHAIQLLLTGCHEFTDHSYLRSWSGGNETEPTPPSIVIKARGRFEANERSHEFWLDWPGDSDVPNFKPDERPRTIRVPGLREGEFQDREFQSRLLARVTTFYPEQVNHLFKTATTGTTLRDIYQPLPIEVRSVLTELDDEEQQIQRDLTSLKEKKSSPGELEAKHSEAQSDLDAAWKPIRTAIETVAKHAELERNVLNQLAALESPRTSQLAQLLRPLRNGLETSREKVGSELMSALQKIVERELDAARKRAAQIAAPERLLRDIEEVKEQLRLINDKYPHLNEWVTCFTPKPAQMNLPDLLAVFETLAEHQGSWLENANLLPPDEHDKLGPVLTELQGVVQDNARACADALKRWLAPLRAMFQLRMDLEERLTLKNAELEKYKMSVEVAALERALATFKEQSRAFYTAYNNRHQWDLLADNQASVERLETELTRALEEIRKAKELIVSATQPDKFIHEAVKELANLVLSRFSIVEGIFPLEVKEISQEPVGEKRSAEQPHTEIKTQSGLNLEQLSTGQRAQLAVSLAVSQSQLLKRSKTAYLPYHILLLDDVSTAYDLSNLTREAILWRQLAYHQDQAERWQLFISSHHEDLTNHLLDLLIPPAGASMRLLRFKGWSFENGPEIDEFKVERSVDVSVPSKNGSSKKAADLRQNLARALKDDLCPKF